MTQQSQGLDIVHHKNHEAYFVPGLHRGLRILEILAEAGRPLGISEIATQLELTRSSVFRLVYTLRHMGFLEDEIGPAKLVSLGPRVLNIGFAFLVSRDIVEVARPELESLRDETAVSAHLAIRDKGDVLYLSCMQTRSGFLSNMNVGARVPAHASPMGWLLLSNVPVSEVRTLVGREPFKSFTTMTPSTMADLNERVRKSAELGYVISRGVMEAGGSSIAAPIKDRAGDVVAAIDISGPDSAFDFDLIESRYVERVKVAANRISQRLG